MFLTQDFVKISKRREQRLVAEKSTEVWQQARPLVMDTFSLKRAENSVIYELPERKLPVEVRQP